MIPDGLLDIVKNNQNITWQDTNTEKKMTTMIENGIAKLDGLSGTKNDYLTAGDAQSLLLSYVSYALVDAIDDFMNNYKKDIISFINRAKVKKYAETKKNI